MSGGITTAPPPELRALHIAGDALHIGVATFHQMKLLLTWNIHHIGNEHVREDLRVLITSLGYTLPTICTPEELLPPP